ncbi:MAG TPA: tripartite tricarboxylate transporter substrate binding protein [Burkholderiales bacterium]|jgi:tripartite-type tricarboxylate transporter receptor subunit TctC|nr:tripartite tricarboxylate transporter substrate binding protein [Burkholderiales bacterium]
MKQNASRIASLLVALMLALPAVAQERTLKFIYAYPPGSTGDILVRLIADRMRVSLGMATIVENKPGAAGIVGTELAKNSPADGSTLLFSPLAPFVAFPHSHGSAVRYDPFKDFEPVAHVTNFQLALVVNGELPAKSLADYVALVKKDPKNGDYASAAAGSLPHYLGVMFSKSAGLQMTHIPYKGSAPALQALVGGEIKAGFFVLADAMAMVRAGKARLLAVAGAKRSASAPDTPTFKELGYDLEASAWYALFAPAKTPKDVIDRYAKAAIEAVHAPDVTQRMEQMGLEPTGYGPAELGKIVRTDYDKWGPVIKASGFKPTQ